MPLRVTGPVAVSGSKATQAAMEAFTSAGPIVTPGRQQFHPGSAKAFCHVTITATVPSITRDFNIDTVEDKGVGDFVLNYTVSFSTATYAGFVGALSLIYNDSDVSIINAQTADDVDVLIKNGFLSSPHAQDADWCFLAFGDQA